MKRCLFFLATLCLALATFAAPAKKPTVVLVSGEFEYHSAETLPVFKQFLETNYPLSCIYLARTGATNENNIPGLDALDTADLAIIFIRRMTLPDEQLAHFRKFADAGKPIIGIRTASHAFQNWKEWDHDVLGGNYQMHHKNDQLPVINQVPAAAEHPILRGVRMPFNAAYSLYLNAPLPEGSVPLLMGSIPDKPAEPVAWTHSYKGGRVFYTSLGHPKDFEHDSFKRLVVNAIFWGLNQPVPEASRTATKPVLKRVGVEEFATFVADKQNVVLDVRSASEFADGHIPGALNMDVHSSDFAKKVGELDKRKTYLVHCAAGHRSAQACSKLVSLGFQSLYDLEPGFNGWSRAKKPVEK